MSIWRPSTTAILIGGVVAIILAVAIAFIVINFQPRSEVRIGTGTFQMRVARDAASREVGLSGVASLKPNEGLLMVFPNDDEWGIWMKDMKVPLDIVWLDASKKTVYLVKNATPELSTDKVFTPAKAARYVLELPAGSVQKYGITLGMVAEFTATEASS